MSPLRTTLYALWKQLSGLDDFDQEVCGKNKDRPGYVRYVVLPKGGETGAGGEPGPAPDAGESQRGGSESAAVRIGPGRAGRGTRKKGYPGRRPRSRRPRLDLRRHRRSHLQERGCRPRIVLAQRDRGAVRPVQQPGRPEATHHRRGPGPAAVPRFAAGRSVLRRFSRGRSVRRASPARRRTARSGRHRPLPLRQPGGGLPAALHRLPQGIPGPLGSLFRASFPGRGLLSPLRPDHPAFPDVRRFRFVSPSGKRPSGRKSGRLRRRRVAGQAPRGRQELRGRGPERSPGVRRARGRRRDRRRGLEYRRPRRPRRRPSHEHPQGQGARFSRRHPPALRPKMAAAAVLRPRRRSPRAGREAQ